MYTQKQYKKIYPSNQPKYEKKEEEERHWMQETGKLPLIHLTNACAIFQNICDCFEGLRPTANMI